MKQEPTNEKLVPAVERAVRILDLVARADSAPNLSAISRELGIAKSTTHGLCNTLVEMNLLARRPDQSFELGPHVMRWSNAFMRNSDVATEFARLWDQETGLPGATITLSVLEGAEVVYIAARNSSVSQSLIDFRAGMKLPAAFTATGKAILSHMSELEVRRLYPSGLPEPRTSHSVRSVGHLIEELRQVRRDNYSLDDQQVAEGLLCFGAAVLDSSNRPIAAIAVSVPSERYLDDSKPDLVSDVQRIAARLSQRMGADMQLSPEEPF